MNNAARVFALLALAAAIVGCPAERPTRVVDAEPSLPAPAPATAPPAAKSASTATSSPPPAAPPATAVQAVDAGTTLRSEWQTCAADAECTFVSLGCCETTPVNRAHATEAQAVLDASGKPYCPVKAACGKGLDGTWKGSAGTCHAGRCAPPVW